MHLLGRTFGHVGDALGPKPGLRPSRSLERAVVFGPGGGRWKLVDPKRRNRPFSPFETRLAPRSGRSLENRRAPSIGARLAGLFGRVARGVPTPQHGPRTSRSRGIHVPATVGRVEDHTEGLAHAVRFVADPGALRGECGCLRFVGKKQVELVLGPGGPYVGLGAGPHRAEVGPVWVSFLSRFVRVAPPRFAASLVPQRLCWRVARCGLGACRRALVRGHRGREGSPRGNGAQELVAPRRDMVLFLFWRAFALGGGLDRATRDLGRSSGACAE